VKRWLPRILLFLLLGAIVNVLVAWIAAAFAPPRGTFRMSQRTLEWRGDVINWWQGHCPFFETSVPRHEYYAKHAERLMASGPLGDALETINAAGIEFVFVQGTVVGSPHLGEVSLRRTRSGWPCLAMEAARWSYEPWGNARRSCKAVRGIAIDPPILSHTHQYFTTRMDGRLLPTRPVWPGFIVNVLFYAAILWLLLLVVSLPFALRRWRRTRRGLCPKCAYPVGTSDRCTECGGAVTPRTVGAQV